MLKNSNNILRLDKIYRTHKRIYIITEACNGGDIDNLRRAKGGFLSEKETRLIMRQIVKGLKELERTRIIHRDIKLQNILINFESLPVSADSQLTSLDELLTLNKRQKRAYLSKIKLEEVHFKVKIADFGFSKYLGSSPISDTMCGTPLYMSPQIVEE